MRNQKEIEPGDNILFYNEDYELVLAQVTEIGVETKDDFHDQDYRTKPAAGILRTFHERDSNVIPIDVCPSEVYAVQTYDGKGESIKGYDGEFQVFDQSGLEDALIEQEL